MAIREGPKYRQRMQQDDFHDLLEVKGLQASLGQDLDSGGRNSKPKRKDKKTTWQQKHEQNRVIKNGLIKQLED